MLDKRTRGRVLGLRVRCSKDGCDWEGELGDLVKHLSKKCLYVEEVCPHGCGQSFPRHLLQTHQQDECPQRPLDVQLGSLQRQLSQKYSIYEQLQQKLMELEKKHDKDKKELQQQLLEQEKKHNEDKKELQQQLMEQRQQLAQQEKKHEKDKKDLLQQLAYQEKKREEDKEALQQQLARQEKKHEDDKKALQQLLARQKSPPLRGGMDKMDGAMKWVKQHSRGRYECGRNAKVEGDLFVFVGFGTRDFRGGSVGVVKILEPMTAELNYFECEIVNKGLRTALGVGLGDRAYPLDRMPGWNRTGIGYHADDGSMFHETGSGSKYGPICTTGDRMGCGVDFSGKAGFNQAFVFFTKNGKKVGSPVAVNKLKNGFYPIVGLDSPGEQVQYLGHRHWAQS